MAYRIKAEDGSILKARFDLDGSTIVFHSQSGGKGDNARNPDYSRALKLVLERLTAAAVPIQTAWVDSSRVQGIPIADRTILDQGDAEASIAERLARMSARMKAVGRHASVDSSHGNHTKRIRLAFADEIATEQLIIVLGAIDEADASSNSAPVPVALAKITPEHIWRALQRLAAGEVVDGAGITSKFEVALPGGLRFQPAAILALTESEAMGTPVDAAHAGGQAGVAWLGTLTRAGLQIVPKGGSPSREEEPDLAGALWAEGIPKLREHLTRERAGGLREAKKSEFRRTHGGKLFCERCGDDPVEKYHCDEAEACIEVHHWKVQVSEMPEGHMTCLEDLQCLCANCHRLVHRELRRAAAENNNAGDH